MNNKLLAGIAMLGLVLLSSLGKTRKEAKLREKSLVKEQVQTWEGEGGNLIVPKTTSANSSK